MTQVSVPTYEAVDAPFYEAPQTYIEKKGYADRRWTNVAPFALPTLACGVSWLVGGIPIITDFGMLLLIGLCAGFLINELIVFNRRMGIGGMLLYGGVLIWFCHDYVSHWMGADFNSVTVTYPAWVIAKTAFWHCFFVMMMGCGLLIQRGLWLDKVIVAVPEPKTKFFYLAIVLVLCAIGISPYALFTAENFFTSLAKAAFPWILGEPIWTVSRTGNLNYDWGGYVAQILQVGSFSGILASFYAVTISRNPLGKILGWTIWGFWTLVAYASDRRGEIVYMAMPVLALTFMKYQAVAATKGKGFSFRAYVLSAMTLLAMLFVIQIQGTFRGVGLENANLSEVELSKNQGNNMFSEGLAGWSTIPEQKDFFYSNFPGESIVRPMPETAFWFIIGPIPRALWNSKPVDPVWEWYNRRFQGTLQGTEGTTISEGIVGNWYFRYGMWGVIEGGILIGWWMGAAERALRRAQGAPIKTMMALGWATFLFRLYRDMYFHILYQLMVGAVVMVIAVWLFNLFAGSPEASPE